MPNSKLKLIGLLAKDGKEYVFIRIKTMVGRSRERTEKKDEGVSEEGGIITQPTPEELKISKEEEKDYSLDGRLKKHKVSKEKLQ